MVKLILVGVLLVLAGCDNKHVAVEESEARFAPVITRIEQGKALSIHSLLVWQAERLILEVYRKGGGLDGSYQTANVPVGKDAIHNVHSVTKSFVATLIFIAIDEGRIESLDTPVLDFFPEYQGSDRQQKMAITIRDVMNMSTGYALDELSTPYGEGNIFSRHYNAKDLQKLFLTTDLAFVPGSRFAYSGLSTIGLSKIIESVYGKSFNQVMKTKLFEPLGISDYQWLPQLGSGEAGADWGLRITSRDMGKFGLMWLNQGRYNGHQIVSEHWFDKLKVSRFPGYEMGYGLHFWQIPNVHNAVAAVGIGEQYIVVIPSKEAVIVTTAGNYKAAGHPVLEVVKHVSELL